MLFPEFIEHIVNQKIILAAMEEEGIKIEVEELQKMADVLRVTNKLTRVDDTYEWLNKYSLSVDDFEEIINISIASEKLSEHLFVDKVEPYFWEKQLNYTGAVMYEIVLEEEDLAIELFYAIKEKEISFYDVAHQYIQDVELRRKGGYLGVKRRSDLTPEVSAEVFATNPPEIIKPIVTTKGVSLIFVEEIIQPRLNDELRQEILKEMFLNWLKNKSNQFITVLDCK